MKFEPKCTFLKYMFGPADPYKDAGVTPVNVNDVPPLKDRYICEPTATILRPSR